MSTVLVIDTLLLFTHGIAFSLDSFKALVMPFGDTSVSSMNQQFTSNVLESLVGPIASCSRYNVSRIIWWVQCQQLDINFVFMLCAICQEKASKRIDEVQCNAESNEKRFRDAGIPWRSNLVNSVKHAALCMFESYMTLALEDVESNEHEEKSRGQGHQKCLDLLTGENKFPARKDYLLKVLHTS